MAKLKYDAVVEAVHYKPDGQVDWVRTYLRRGPIFSDYVMLDRQSLIDQLKGGKIFLMGDRVRLMGGTFNVSEPLKVITQDGREVLVTGDRQADQDRLEGVPVI